MCHMAWIAPSQRSFSNAGFPCEAARQTVEARLAQAAQSDGRLDRGWLIIPTMLTLGAAGWLIPLIALGYALAPFAAIGFVLRDRFVPSSATDRYHGL